jgi:hypothetical protein
LFNSTHLQRAGDERQHEHQRYGVAIRLEPAQVFAEVLSLGAGRQLPQHAGLAFGGRVGAVVETMMLVVVDERGVPLAGRARLWLSHVSGVRAMKHRRAGGRGKYAPRRER